jgi:hypothetical protein
MFRAERPKGACGLLLEAYQLPDHQEGVITMPQLKRRACALVVLLLGGCAGVDKVGPEVSLPPEVLRAVARSAADQMKDPGSVEFRNWHAFESQNGLLVCGEINAKNGFGGYVGFIHFVAHASPDGRLLMPVALSSTSGGGSDALIDSVWKQYYPGCY